MTVFDVIEISNVPCCFTRFGSGFSRKKITKIEETHGESDSSSTSGSSAMGGSDHTLIFKLRVARDF